MNNSENLMLEVINTINTIDGLYETIQDREDKITEIFKQYISDFTDPSNKLRVVYARHDTKRNSLIAFYIPEDDFVKSYYNIDVDSFMEYAKTTDKAIPFQELIKHVDYTIEEVD